LFVAGIKSGMFSVPLDNVDNPVVGGQAGKTITSQNYYQQIPSGSLLTSAAVSKDGQFAIATSKQRDLRVWGCLNPLGDPGDPSLPINPFFFVPSGNEVLCMQVGSNNLDADLTTAFGPDNQPYFGGQRVINSFNSVPGSSDLVPRSTAWPNCIWQNTGAASLTDAFVNFFQNGCGSAQPNFAFTSALVTQPNALISHGKYMYTGPIGGTVYQFLVKVNPFSGRSEYKFRTYVTGLSIVTGLGTDDALQSLFIYSDPTVIGLSGREFVTKVPLCEDMDGEVVTVAGNPPTGGIGSLTGGSPTGGQGTGGTTNTLVQGVARFSAASTGAATGASSTTTGGLIIPGGGVPGGGVTASAGVTPTGADPTTTGAASTIGANPTSAGAFAAQVASSKVTTTGAGVITPSVLPTQTITTDAGATSAGTSIMAIGGFTNGISANGTISGPTFTVKLVPKGGG
jgi:hypothetical protein